MKQAVGCVIAGIPETGDFKYYMYTHTMTTKRQYTKYRKDSIEKPGTTERRYDLEQKYYKGGDAYKLAQRQRAKNRRLFLKMGWVTKGDGSQIHHVNGNPLDNRLANLAVVRNQCEHNIAHGKRCKNSVVPAHIKMTRS